MYSIAIVIFIDSPHSHRKEETKSLTPPNRFSKKQCLVSNLSLNDLVFSNA